MHDKRVLPILYKPLACMAHSSCNIPVGDFVDRGAWGLEVLILLACWKLAYPKHVTILRGNHECTTCTHMYGFRTEVLSKYGPKNFKVGFSACRQYLSVAG